MITKFENYLITENPDRIESYDDKHNFIEYGWYGNQAKPFFSIVNDNHTKVERLYVGDYDVTHDDIRFNNKDTEKSMEELVSYPGRIFLKAKIITFWVYPNVKLFIDMVQKLEKRLRRKIFNNGWRIEVVKNGDEIETFEFNPNEDDLAYYGFHKIGENTKIIPLDDYAGSKNPPKEERIMHMMNWKEKQLAKKQGKLDIKGWGSDKTAWDSPHNIQWRQAIYQEKKSNDDN